MWIIERELCVRGRRNKQLKDVFVKAQCFCYNNGKNLFSNMVKVTVERSCLKSLVSGFVQLYFLFFLFQWLQLFIYFFICSYACLCPTWLSGYQPIEPKKRPFCLFLPRAARLKRSTSENKQRAEKSPLQLTFARASLLLGFSSSLSSSFLHLKDSWPPRGMRLSWW